MNIPELPKQTPGRPTCYCGFVGNTKNICEHRRRCPAWTRVTTLLMIETMKAEIERLMATQGWNDSTVLELVLRFIQREGHKAELLVFLEKMAREENQHAKGAHSD